MNRGPLTPILADFKNVRPIIDLVKAANPNATKPVGFVIPFTLPIMKFIVSMFYKPVHQCKSTPLSLGRTWGQSHNERSLGRGLA